jgi:TPR repeat protein
MKNLTVILCLTLTLLLGNTGNSESTDFQKGIAAFDGGDYATALHKWTPLSEQSNADVQNRLGAMHQNGWGVPKDYKAAVK